MSEKGMMEKTTVTIDEAYQILKEKASSRSARIITTLFVPTVTLEGILKLRTFNVLPILAITLHGMTEGHCHTTKVQLPAQPEAVKVRKYLTPEKFELRAKYENGVTLDELQKVQNFALINNLIVGVQRILVEHEDKLLDFRSFRPKGIANPISQLATYIGKMQPVRVLDLQQEHDLYTLKKLQTKLPHSELRLCEIKGKAGYEASCRFVT